MIHGMNHFTITAEDRAQTLDYYCGLLGLSEGHRPDLGFPGAWLYAGGDAGGAAHLLGPADAGHSAPASSTTWPSARAGLKAMKARFDARGWKYDLRQQAGAGTWQLFSHDPNGARVELDFDASESL